MLGVMVLLFQSLKETNLGTLSRIQLMEIQGTLFGNKHFHKPTETLESYTARTLRMPRDLQDNDISFSPKQLKTSFIFGLGKDFNDIIKKDLLNKLSHDRYPMQIQDLVKPAHEYEHVIAGVRTHSTNLKNFRNQAQQDETNQNKDTKNQDKLDTDRKCRVHQAINAHKFNADDFKHEFGKDWCVFHNRIHPGSKDSSHECRYILECIKIANEKPHLQQNPPPSKPISSIQTPPMAKTVTILPHLLLLKISTIHFNSSC